MKNPERIKMLCWLFSAGNAFTAFWNCSLVMKRAFSKAFASVTKKVFFNKFLSYAIICFMFIEIFN